MTEASKVWVSLPDKLLAELDNVAQVSGLSRDAALCRAVEVYLHRSADGVLTTAMAQGYKEMAELNLALALDDEETLSDWPEVGSWVPEADPSGGV